MSLESIQEVYSNKYNLTTRSSPTYIDYFGRKMHKSKLQSQQEKVWVVIHPDHIAGREIFRSKLQSQQEIEDIDYWHQKVGDKQEVIDSIRDFAKQIFSLPIGSIGFKEDKLYGIYIEIEVFGSEREILEKWIRLIDILKSFNISIPVYPRISGKLDASPEEFGRFVGLALSKMNVSLAGEKSFNIVEILSQERQR